MKKMHIIITIILALSVFLISCTGDNEKNNSGNIDKQTIEILNKLTIDFINASFSGNQEKINELTPDNVSFIFFGVEPLLKSNIQQRVFIKNGKYKNKIKINTNDDSISYSFTLVFENIEEQWKIVALEDFTHQ